MKLNLLAFETSSSRCGVALLRQDGGPPELAQLEHDGAQEHAERLLPMAGELLARAGLAPAALDAVAFGQGPGGFTGLRVACGVAQGIALGLGLPVVPVVSHLAVAEDAQAGPDDAVLVALDARMEEVYLAVYMRASAQAGVQDSIQDSGGGRAWRVLQEPLLIAAAEVVPWAQHHLPAWSRQAGRALSLLLAGDAWRAYPAISEAGLRQAPLGRPRAATVARLARQAWLRGETLPPEEAAPLYVRDKVAFTTAERERGQGGNPRASSALPAAEAYVLSAMSLGDLDEVAALEAQVQDFPWTRGNFDDALRSGYPACVLRLGAQLAGFCVMMPAPDVAHLLVIAVARDRQRHGLGHRLVDWCHAQAVASGAEGILLEVRPSNENARRFYERLGFRQIGVRKGYYPAAAGREDALVLRRDVLAQGRRDVPPGGGA
ncbi:MAG TPA: tRNA (adenosine(37)-N6)-threonylcarbamoyltransferase complex dimerization subunit type 1 TsaB [Bordetella sp.]